MKNKTNYTEMPNDEKNFPRISLIISFDPKMRSPSGLHKLLTIAADEKELELMTKYPEERVMPVINRLRGLIENLGCGHYEKSIAFFVSPLAEKVYYFTPTDPSQKYFPPVLIERNNA